MQLLTSGGLNLIILIFSCQQQLSVFSLLQHPVTATEDAEIVD